MNKIEEKVNTSEDVIEEEVEEVLSFTENSIVLFKINSIVSKSLLTNRVKKSFQNTIKSLKTFYKLKSQENNYLITICGEDRSKVIESKMKLSQFISMARRKKPLTHLITVPFNSGPLAEEFNRFKDNVLSNFKDCNGIDETLFQRSHKLHLTFGVLVLLNESEILLAKRVLKQSVDQIIRPIVKDKPLKITVEGIDIMKGQPNKAHVLYAQIKDESNRFQLIADQMVEQFVKSGLLEESIENENKVKLHITFMNSLFRQRINSKTFKKRIKREAFDAKPIIDFYNSHKFCELVVGSIQLNEFKTTTEEGFYGLVESIDLPKQ